MFDTPRKQKLLLVGSSLLNTLFFSGIIFGWAPLSVMLEEEGQYSEDCDSTSRGAAPGDGLTCPEQASKFAAIFALATFLVNGISLPSGNFLDACGGRAMSTGAMVFNFCGLLLLGVSDSKVFDYFMVGYGLLAIGGQMTLFSVFPTAFEIPEYQTLVFATNSCLFDGSCIVFQLLSSLHEGMGWSRRDLFFGYAALSVPLYAFNIYAWKFSGGGPGEPEAAHTQGQQQQQQQSSDLSPSSSSSKVATAASRSMNSSPRFSPRHRPTNLPHNRSNNSLHPRLNSSSRSNNGGNGERSSLTNQAKKEEEAVVVSELGLWEQLRTPQFWFILVFASVGILRANLYIASNEQLLMNLGDKQPPNNLLYSHLFGYLLPMGFLFIPAIDASVGKGMRVALHATNALAIAVALLMLVPSLQVQVVNFLTFAAFRAFLYGVMGAYIGATFGPLTLGRITGCVFTVGSVVNLLQAPLVDATNFYFEGSTTALALVVLLMGVVMVVPISLNTTSGQAPEEDQGESARGGANGKYVEVEVTETPLV